MTEDIKRQLAEKAGNSSQDARKSVAPTPSRSEAVGERDAPKEQPGPKADTPVRWQEAGALFRESHPGLFRLVVVGKQTDLPAVLAALTALRT